MVTLKSLFRPLPPSPAPCSSLRVSPSSIPNPPQKILFLMAKFLNKIDFNTFPHQKYFSPCPILSTPQFEKQLAQRGEFSTPFSCVFFPSEEKNSPTCLFTQNNLLFFCVKKRVHFSVNSKHGVEDLLSKDPSFTQPRNTQGRFEPKVFLKTKNTRYNQQRYLPS